MHRLFRKTPQLAARPADGPNTYTVTLWDLPTWSEVDVVVDERLARKADGSGLLGASPSSDAELWVCYLEKVHPPPLTRIPSLALSLTVWVCCLE